MEIFSFPVPHSVSQEQRDAQRVAMSWLRGVFGVNNSLKDVVSSSARYLCFIVLLFFFSLTSLLYKGICTVMI